MSLSLHTAHQNSAMQPPPPVSHATDAGRGAFRCASRDEFLARVPEIARHVSTHGYAAIEAWDAEVETLKEISQRFGRVQSHIRADANGVVGISVDTVVNHEWEKYRSEYHGVSSEKFLPHTDGTSLHGLVHRDGSYIQILPPGMLFLQCWQMAAVGGANILIDGQHVFDDLRTMQPRFAEILSRKGCVSYSRDDQIAVDRAVFETQADGNIALRFRYDNTAYVADWALEAFRTLQNDYWANPKYWTRLALRKGQILAIDNTRMLHGREAFVAGEAGNTRSMRRVWLAREHLPVLRNAAGQHKDRRALKRFEAYNIMDASGADVGSSSLLLGIRPAM